LIVILVNTASCYPT